VGTLEGGKPTTIVILAVVGTLLHLVSDLWKHQSNSDPHRTVLLPLSPCVCPDQRGLTLLTLSTGHDDLWGGEIVTYTTCGIFC